jgi:hypothetical protein
MLVVDSAAGSASKVEITGFRDLAVYVPASPPRRGLVNRDVGGGWDASRRTRTWVGPRRGMKVGGGEMWKNLHIDGGRA